MVISLDLNKSSLENYTSWKNDLAASQYKYHELSSIILIGTYIPLFLVALISNILLIIVVTKYRCLQSVTNYFLVNLSIADLLVTLICMPMSIAQAVHKLWLYGNFMCKFSNYLQAVAVSLSVFTFTAMTIDRYYAIRHPLSRKILDETATLKVIAVLWILAMAICAPILFIRKLDGYKFLWDPDIEHLYCIEFWPDSKSQQAFGVLSFLVEYVIPGFIVVGAYSLMGLRLCSEQLLPEYPQSQCIGDDPDTTLSELNHPSSQVSSAGARLVRERKRVAKILLLLALLFAICWLPYSVLNLILDMTSKPASESINSDEEAPFQEQLELITKIFPFAVLLGHVNSALNPLVYCILSKNFRRSAVNFLRHPTQVFRQRPSYRMRMNFRREMNTRSRQTNSQTGANRRSRNHLAPDPSDKNPTENTKIIPVTSKCFSKMQEEVQTSTQPSLSQSSGRADPNEIRLVNVPPTIHEESLESTSSTSRNNRPRLEHGSDY